MWVGFSSRHTRTAVWGTLLTPTPSCTQSPREREINKETQEVLIWYCPDLFFRKHLLDARQDVLFPLHVSSVCFLNEELAYITTVQA